MNKIKRVSQFFRLLILVIMVLVPLSQALFWIQAPEPLRIGHYLAGLGPTLKGNGITINYIPQTLQILHPFTPTDRMNGFLISLIPTLMMMLICFYLQALFKLYQTGTIFSFENVRLIKKLGVTLAVSQLAQPFYQFLLSMALTWDNPIHERYGYIQMTQTNIAILLVGIIMVLISWIMAEGHKLQEEQEYTV